MNKVKEMRQKMGLTQKELANKSGLSLAEIKKIETNCVDLRECRVKNIEKLSKVLKCSINNLLN